MVQWHADEQEESREQRDIPDESSLVVEKIDLVRSNSCEKILAMQVALEEKIALE